MNVLLERVKAQTRYLTLPPDVRVAQRNLFRNQSSTVRGETDDNDHDVSVEAFTKLSRI